jgi:multidrug efflux pump subunit AcrA (membrane-fusion protein)
MERRLNLDPFFRAFAHLSLVVFALAGGLTACGKKSASGPAGGFATQVIAVKANREAITEHLRVVGMVLANETVDLKPEVDGRVAIADILRRHIHRPRESEFRELAEV